MAPQPRIPAHDGKRKALHAGMGLFALALRFLSWPAAALLAAAALVFNVAVMPRFGRGVYRDAGKRHDPGIIAYPAVVLAVVLLFRHDLEVAAAIWGMMAVGDPMASVAGKRIGGPALPWNRKKTWAGSIAYAALGGLAGSLLLGFVGRIPFSAAFSAFAGYAVLGAFLESIETGFDDNLTPGLGVAFAYGTFHLGAFVGGGFSRPGVVPVDLPVALAVNAAIAGLSTALRVVSLSGGIAGAIAGLLVLRFGGWGAYAVLWAFFLFGTVASKLGYSRKERLGTAQANRARRGARHVAANVGVGAWLAFAAGSRAAAAPILALAISGAFAAALADTFGTELGTLYGRAPFLISRGRRVAPGTRGAVSLAGLLGGLLGAALVGAVGAAAGLYAARLVWIVVLAGLIGSVAESLLIDLSARSGVSADHEFCNAFNTLVGAAAAVEIAASLALGRAYFPFSGLA